MGTRDDEYDYLFKGGIQAQPNFKSCVQQHLSATPVPLSSVNLKTWQLLHIKSNNNCTQLFSVKFELYVDQQLTLDLNYSIGTICKHKMVDLI